MEEIKFQLDTFESYKDAYHKETKELPQDNWAAYFAFVSAKIAAENYNLTLELKRQLNSYIEERNQSEGK
jgi:hypothetical protein